jgi:hypothetical protein
VGLDSYTNWIKPPTVGRMMRRTVVGVHGAVEWWVRTGGKEKAFVTVRTRRKDDLMSE